MMGSASPADSIDPEEIPPVTATERLYRRLLTGWYKPGKPKPIPQRFFMPRPWVSDEKPGDLDGLSVNRAFLTDIFKASTRPDNGQRADLAKFGVADVFAIGLSVIATVGDPDPSHAIIPELNSLDHRDAQKAKEMEEWAIALRDRAVLIPATPISLNEYIRVADPV